jgi:protein phosphatase
MGGHAGGDIASSIAIAQLSQLDEDVHRTEEANQLINASITQAREDLLEQVEENPALAGLGTTVTLLLRTGDHLTLGHIGDSRAYVLRDGDLTQATTDHTVVQHLVSVGRLTPEQAERHPQRSLLLRVLGDVEIGAGLDIAQQEVHVGDRWLLCSDGLSGVVSLDTLTDTLKEIQSVDQCAEQLITLALRAGGPDNITCIVADVVDLDTMPDGTAPDQTPHIVGAAAIDRNKPSRGGGGAAEKAAALTPKPEPKIEEEVLFAGTRRKRPWLLVLIIVALIAVVGGSGYGAYSWTQTQYYVGIADGNVAIYQGVDQTVGPFHLSHVVEKSGVKLEDLPPFYVDTLEDTISCDSLGAARAKVDEIAASAVESDT